MVSISLNENDVKLLKTTINHCLQTCGNDASECPDCSSLESILGKLK